MKLQIDQEMLIHGKVCVCVLPDGIENLTESEWWHVLEVYDALGETLSQEQTKFVIDNCPKEIPAFKGIMEAILKGIK